MRTLLLALLMLTSGCSWQHSTTVIVKPTNLKAQVCGCAKCDCCGGCCSKCCEAK